MALIAPLLLSVNVLATGFPVLDVANYLQNLESYLNDLATYSETVNNTIQDVKTAQNTLNQYRKLQEQYNLLTRQAEQLHSSMTQHQWDAMWHEAIRMSKERPFMDTDLRSATFGLYGTEKIKDTVENEYGKELNKADMQALATSTLGEVPEEFSRSYENSNLAIYQAGQVSSFEKRNAEQRKQIKTIDSERQKLGDKSELKTLQLIAGQNQILLGQIADMSDLQKTQLELSNRDQNERAAKDQQRKQEQLKRIQYLNNHPIKIDETPLLP